MTLHLLYHHHHHHINNATFAFPLQVTQYLTTEFYSLNYSLRQRLDILEVTLISASLPDRFPGLKSNRDVVPGASGARFCSAGALEADHWKERTVCGHCRHGELWVESIRQWQTCRLATGSRKADSKQDKASQKGICSRWTFVSVIYFYLTDAVPSFLMCFRVRHSLHQRPAQTVTLLWLDTSSSLCWGTMTGRC